jgi:hypothetical protein
LRLALTGPETTNLGAKIRENRTKQADFFGLFKPQEARHLSSDEQSSHPWANESRKTTRPLGEGLVSMHKDK